jgi:hypothetical protein
MLVPTSSYRMSKQFKIFLANSWNRPGKTAYCRSLIQADLAGRQVTAGRRASRNDT